MKSTVKRKRPTMGAKKNEPSFSEEEANDIKSILMKHKELLEEPRIEKT